MNLQELIVSDVFLKHLYDFKALYQEKFPQAMPIAAAWDELEKDYAEELGESAGIDWQTVAVFLAQESASLARLACLKIAEWDVQFDEVCDDEYDDTEALLGQSTLIINALEILLCQQGRLSAWLRLQDWPQPEAYLKQLEAWWARAQ